MYTIYYNANCSTCRKTLGMLRDHDIEPHIVNYLDDTLSTDEIKILVDALGTGPRSLLRVKEKEYRDLDLNADNLTDDEIIAAMASNPVLIQRPVVMREKKAAIIARPPETVLAFIGAT